MTLGELAAMVGGELDGPADLEIERPGGWDEGRPGEIVVAFNEAAAAVADQTGASAVIVPRGVSVAKPSIGVDQPRQALVAIVAAFDPPVPAAAGVHPTAVIDPSVSLPADITIGPYTVLGAGVVLGIGCRLGAHVVIGDRCRLGDGVVIHPRVTLYRETEVGDRTIIQSGAVIGADGYGYLQLEGRHVKIPQLGRVVIGPDVEIGANTCIDRAMVGSTVVGGGSKIDNLVQVAHNVRLGQHVLLVSQCGIAGSCRLGDYVVLGGQVGLKDHVTIGDGAQVAAKSGVMRDIEAGQTMAGAPAQPQADWFRQLALARRLPEFSKRLRAVEKQLAGWSGSGEDDDRGA